MGMLFCILSTQLLSCSLSGEGLGLGAGGLRLLGSCRGKEGGEKGQEVADGKAGELWWEKG